MRMTIIEGWGDSEIPYLLPEPATRVDYSPIYSLRDDVHLVCMGTGHQDDNWRLYTDATLDDVVETLKLETIANDH